jgi:hypothetical protein
VAKQLLSFQFRIDVNVIAGTKRIIYCSGSANDTVLTAYTAGVSCDGLPTALTTDQLNGTLAAFIAAHQATLEGNM